MLTLVVVGAAAYLAGIGTAIGALWWAKRKIMRELASAAPPMPPPGFKLMPVKGGRR